MRSPAVPHSTDVIKSSTNLEESKVSSSRVVLQQQQQHSMRRSKLSGELDRDMMANVPSTRLSTPAPPLNPVTPLRWKSSKRLELEKKKLQEETRAKEVQVKKPSAKEEEKKDTRLNKLSTKSDQKAEKDGDLKLQSSPNGDLKLQSSTNGDLKLESSTNGGSTETKMREETQASVDRKSVNAGDESSVVTIDSLRARLLAERANSKAAKERVQQLTKKVFELEARLDHEIQARKKADESAQEALLKCESLGKQVLSKESPHVIMESTTSKLPNQVTPEAAEKSKEDDGPAQVNEANSISAAAVVVTNLESNKALPEPENVPNEENLTSDQKHGVQNVEKVEDAESLESTSIDSGLEQQKGRLSGEERLRHMWDQMTQEMAALAQDKTQDQERVLNWMGQVPSVFQDIIQIPKPSEDKKLAIDSSTKNIQLKDADVMPNLDQVQKPVEGLPLKGASSGLKKVASLIERFEAQESGQREMEHKKNSIGRRRSNENSTTQTNKTSGIPHSPELQQEQLEDHTPELQQEQLEDHTPQLQQEQLEDHTPELQQEQLEDHTPQLQQEQLEDHTPPKLVEDPKHNSHPANASASGKTTIRKENKKVDPQTPKITIPIVQVVEKEGIIPCARTEDFLEDVEAGSGRSSIASFMTPPHGKKQSNHDLSSAYEDAQTPTDRDSASQWDVGLQLMQHDKLGSFNSQAGNSNAYIRPEVPGSYPLRDDEREIYRGRMESVSRSMEGLGHSYMSDPEGDEDIVLESGSTRLQMPFQVPGGSGRSNGYQGESTSQSFTYPCREFPSRPPAKHDNSATKVNEVLKALQLAKLSIQKTGARRTSISNTCYSTSDHSTYSNVERRHNLKTEYGFDGMSNRSPVAIRVWSHQELSRRYSTGGFREAGSPPRLQYNTTSPASFGKYPEPEDRPLAGRSSPVGSNEALRKFVDKISSGGGVQYFYPS